jgi:hypothetical protein
MTHTFMGGVMWGHGGAEPPQIFKKMLNSFPTLIISLLKKLK